MAIHATIIANMLWREVFFPAESMCLFWDFAFVIWRQHFLFLCAHNTNDLISSDTNIVVEQMNCENDRKVNFILFLLFLVSTLLALQLPLYYGMSVHATRKHSNLPFSQFDWRQIEFNNFNLRTQCVHHKQIMRRIQCVTDECHLLEFFKRPIQPAGGDAEIRLMRCHMMYAMMFSWQNYVVILEE